MKLKRYLPVLLLLVFLLPAAMAEEAARTAEDAEMLRRVCRSVVRLYGVGYDRDGNPVSRWSGTGFAVGVAGEDTDLFLTNRHVATGNGRFTPRNLRIWLVPEGASIDGEMLIPDGWTECQVLSAPEDLPDVAVIRALDPVSGYPALPMASSRTVPDGTPVYALGFPGLNSADAGASAGDRIISCGSITDHMTMTGAGNVPCLIHNAPIRPGCSGGPLVDRQGIVVGVNAYGFSEDVTDALFCAVYTDYGMTLLEQLGAEYTAVPGASPIAVFLAGLRSPGCILAGVLLVLLLLILPGGKAIVRYIQDTVRRSS